MAQQAEEETNDDIHHQSARIKQLRNNNRRLSSSSMNSLLSSSPDDKTPLLLLPISITVRNLFPPLVASTARNNNIASLSSKISSLTMVQDRCTLVATDVLLRIRLDILIKSSSSTRSSSEESTTAVPEEVVLYSSEKLNYTAHPRWDHDLDEQMQMLSDDENGQNYNSNDDDDLLLANLYARFVAIRHHDSSETQPATTVEQDDDDILLAEVSLHPSNLRRLPPAKDDDDDDPTTSTNTNNNNSGKNTLIIPDLLPPNAILFHYADGYTRVVPNLYELLLQKGIITENIMELDPIIRGSEKEEDDDGEGDNNQETTTIIDKEEEKHNKSVFEDDVFDVLDNIPSDGAGVDEENVKKNAVINNSSADDNIIDGKKACAQPTSSSEVGHANNNNDDDEGPATNGIDDDDETMDTRSILTEETDSHDAIIMDNNNTYRNNNERELLLSPAVQKIQHLPPIVDPLPQLPLSSDDADTEKRSSIATCNTNIDNEIEELKRVIHQERLLLEQERNQMEEETNHITWIMEQIQQINQESILQVMKTTGIESTALYRSEFRLEAHRIRLLKQLQSILPIRVTSINNIAVNPPQYPQHQYTIASIPLPDDIHSASVSDDQLSTSIGFLCYLVSLTSKYLAITPRYKLVCRFSRSAIIDDHTYPGDGGVLSVNNKPVVYPLFRERGAVDKEQLDRGFALLVRNIECLLQMRKVEFHRGWNALAKMEKLCMHVVDGSVD